MWESEGGRGGDASAARAGERPCSGLGAGREWARAVGCAEGGNGRVDGGSRMRCPGARHLSLTSADRPCSSTGTTVLSR